MASCLLVLMFPFIFGYAAASTCDPKIVEAIKNSQQDSDNSGILDKLSGQYLAEYISAGWFTSVLRWKCIKATYNHDAGGVTVDYQGITSGKYNAKYADGAIQFSNADGTVMWKSYVVQSSDNVFTIYTCTDHPLVRFAKIAVSTINVKAGTLDSSSEAIQEGKAALEKLGITNLVSFFSCPID